MSVIKKERKRGGQDGGEGARKKRRGTRGGASTIFLNGQIFDGLFTHKQNIKGKRNRREGDRGVKLIKVGGANVNLHF